MVCPNKKRRICAPDFSILTQNGGRAEGRCATLGTKSMGFGKSRKMVDVIEYTGEGYFPLVDFESWRVAFLRYNERFSRFAELERHLETDEVFVLLTGDAMIYTRDANGEQESFEMLPCKIYNVKKGVWHHIVVSRDATVLIVENVNTTDQNTEKISL